MTYVDGFITAVPTANKDKYLAHARNASAMLKEFGVTRFVECWSDDVPRGKLNDLWGAVEAGDDETVVFSWFEYPDKATRDAASARMMEDPRMADMMKDMPFDAARMIYGGFAGISEAGPGGEPGYVDGMVAPVVTARRDGYVSFARQAAAVFLEHGATRVLDALGDDVPDGERTDFKRAARLEEGESVAFGWIEWPSKEVRDRAWEQVMQDDRLTGDSAERGLDGKRMMFGGFRPLLVL